MTKNDLAQELAVSEHITLSTACKAIDGLIRIAGDALAKNEAITLRGFGSLTPVECARRTVHNPKTGEVVTVEAHRSVKFKTSKELKEKINKPQSKAL